MKLYGKELSKENTKVIKRVIKEAEKTIDKFTL